MLALVIKTIWWKLRINDGLGVIENFDMDSLGNSINQSPDRKHIQIQLILRYRVVLIRQLFISVPHHLNKGEIWNLAQVHFFPLTEKER